MERELTYNGINFTDDFITEILMPQLPDDYVKFWEIDNFTKTGGVRFKDGIIESVYLFVSAKGQDEAILKFIKPIHIDYYYFDSLYVRYDINEVNEYDEYRYNLENEIVATYNFFPIDEGDGHFCNQYKNGELDKKYIFSHETFPSYYLQRLIDDNIVTNFDTDNTNVDGFYPESDKNTIYYYIR
jgi:hypothetical protein